MKTIDVNKVDMEKILISDKFAYGKNKETDAKHFKGNMCNTDKLDSYYS